MTHLAHTKHLKAGTEMAETTGINWCDSTFNPWIGCTRVSPGCDDCYAARSTPARTLGVVWGSGQLRQRTSEANWKLVKRWNNRRFMECSACGWRGDAAEAVIGCARCRSLELDDARRRVFCASLADVFDTNVPQEWRTDLFELILATPQLDWLLLTKRIGNVKHMVMDSLGAMAARLDQRQPKWPWVNVWPEWPWANVWIGATITSQAEADRDIPKLLATPAAVRFLSVEPMLGAIDLTRVPVGGGHGHHEFDPIITANALRRGAGLPTLQWVICGGESGPRARPMHPDWARSLRDQCAAAGVPFLFKQWGEWGPDWEGAQTCNACSQTKFDSINSHGECGHCGIEAWNPASKPLDTLRRVGKKAAGRLLDGRTHDQFPARFEEMGA